MVAAEVVKVRSESQKVVVEVRSEPLLCFRGYGRFVSMVSFWRFRL